jgi:hypothetical protein
MGNERITLTDNLQDVVIKLSEGNPGALNVCMCIMQDDNKIDPQNMLGGLGTLLSLDTHSIYGSHIWLFYKDVCGENLTNILGVLRGVQLGILPESQLKTAIEMAEKGNQHTLNVAEVLKKVKEELTEFDKEASDV